MSAENNNKIVVTKENVMESISKMSMDEKQSIQMPEATNKLLEYITLHQNSTIPNYADTTPKPTTLRECCEDEKDADYVETLFENRPLFFSVLKLAYYLGLTNLVSLMSTELVIAIRDKTVDESLKIINKGSVDENMTAEGLANIIRENELNQQRKMDPQSG